MVIEVDLLSGKPGEIKRFLERYYEKEISIDEDVDEWICVYNKPLEAIDIISVMMDNKDKFLISMYMRVGKGNIYPVTIENHNDIIKGIFGLFYKEIQGIIY